MKLNNVIKAEKELKTIIKKTSLIETSLCNNCNLYLKPENLQITGSFKIRGAFNKIINLTDEEKKRGVIACSAGNHAQGVALASKIMGIKAVICMPASAPKIKIESTKKFDAEVVLVDGVYDDAHDKAVELQKKYGYTFVHPFNDEKVIEGQGTIAYEILEELPETDIIICAIGGGGLVSGVAAVAKLIKPDVKVYGVQAIGAPSMYASFANEYVTKIDKIKTFADGIAVKEVGDITYEYTSKYVDDVLVVSEEEILDAIKTMMTKEKIVAEGAGAASLAAVLSNHVPEVQNKNVVCVISGGNIDIDTLSKIILLGID